MNGIADFRDPAKHEDHWSHSLDGYPMSSYPTDWACPRCGDRRVEYVVARIRFYNCASCPWFALRTWGRIRLWLHRLRST